MVIINYRVGPLGFFTLGTEEAPGNVGLLDQVGFSDPFFFQSQKILVIKTIFDTFKKELKMKKSRHLKIRLRKNYNNE